MANIMNSLPVPSPTRLRVVSTIERPRLRMDMKVLPKSWMPPTNIAPTRIHSKVGPQPKYMPANIGPTMGPAPAIEEK